MAAYVSPLSGGHAGVGNIVRRCLRRIGNVERYKRAVSLPEKPVRRAAGIAVMAADFAIRINGRRYRLGGVWQLECHDDAIVPAQKALPAATPVGVPPGDLPALVDSHGRSVVRVRRVGLHHAAIPFSHETRGTPACLGVTAS